MNILAGNKLAISLYNYIMLIKLTIETIILYIVITYWKCMVVSIWDHAVTTVDKVGFLRHRHCFSEMKKDIV